jgi:LacI family transcriptional regulator
VAHPFWLFFPLMTRMRSKHRKRKNVLLVLGWYDHRLLQGIAAYAVEHHWHLAASSITHERVIPWGWQGDGMLAWLAGGEDLADFVMSVNKPTVDFSLRRSELPFARVVQAHAMAGRLAAEHILTRGFRRFIYYSHMANWSYDERGAGFVEALKEAGHACMWLRWHDAKENRRGLTEWSRRRAWLLAQIKRASKPVAIFTANGSLAVEVQEICDEAEITVPRDVAIVGIEDYEGGVLHSISGVDTNVEEQGYQGAALLDRLMAGESPPPEPVRIQPARVVTRKSTDIMAVGHPGVSRALRFMVEHLSRSISVSSAAQAAGMSRRSLYQAFLKELGRTPGDELRSMRIEQAKRLLAESDLKIHAVATQSGYPNMNSFFMAFKKAVNASPAEYRKAAQRGH